MRRFLSLMLAPLLFASCGGPGGTPTGLKDTYVPDRGKEESSFFEVLSPFTDIEEGPSEKGPSGQSDSSDVVESLVPCNEGSECPSGFCLDTGDGARYCAPLCLGDTPCPPGWECRPISGTGGDVTFLCVPLSNRLCRPCIYHDECKVPGLGSNDRCIDFGPAGSFCGRDCSLKDECPQGYECLEVPDSVDRSKTYKQCVPASGECECTAEFIENGYKTVCYVENEYGRCYGTRKCAEGGLTPCDAQTPTAEECDGFDNNCDGQTDEGIKPKECERTFEGIVCKGPEVCEGGQWVCKAQEPGPEKCDGVDNDCDGVTDPEASEGCTNYYRDEDGDAYGVTSDFVCLCGAKPPHTALVGGDCNDQDASVNPGIKEACNGLDDDCDGLTDEEGANGCKDYFKDEDGDGYGVGGDKKCLCSPIFPYTAPQAGDCDDSEASVHPGVSETCNGRDDDCDGVKDPADSLGCADYYYDHDGDGFGVKDNKKCLCGPEGKYTATKGGDCDDLDTSVYPGAAEKCNNKDDDCDGSTDEDFPQKGAPCDGPDGDQCKEGTYICNATGNGYDCTDMTDTISEVCNNIDDDCDGLTDEDLYRPCSSPCGSGTETCVAGQWKNCTAPQPKMCMNYQTCTFESLCVSSCSPPPPESCNNKDDDCDGATDEDVTRPCSSMCGTGIETCHAGKWENCTAPQPKTCLNYNNCQMEPMCVSSCPAAPPEQCNNKDDNCNGQTDENLTRPCSTMCGYGLETCSFGNWVNCTAPKPKSCFDYSTCSYKDMCVDSCPGAPPESCNGKDDDCDGQTDEDFWDDDGCTNCGDFPNAWFGTVVYRCESRSCSGQTMGRILPQGDIDYFRIYKKETVSYPWDYDLVGEITFTSAPGAMLTVCACWSKNNKCDEASQECKSAVSEVQLSVTNDDDLNYDDSSYLDVWVSAYDPNGWSCYYYTVSWTVKE